MFVEEKLGVARFVLESAPVPASMAQYVAFQMLAARHSDAELFLKSLRLRNPYVADQTENELKRLVSTSKELEMAWKVYISRARVQ
ncbi:MAG: hypothetical protein QM742_14005 [Aquabacterium sp.]